MRNKLSKILVSLLMGSAPMGCLYAQTLTWGNFDRHQYEQDLPIYLTIKSEVSGFNLNNFSVAAFVGDENRGEVNSSMWTNAGLVYCVRAWTNTGDENISFRMRSNVTGHVYELKTDSASYAFGQTDILGSPNNPIELVFDQELPFEETPGVPYIMNDVWKCYYSKYEQDMVANVSICDADGSRINKIASYQLGAFIGDECRGIAQSVTVVGDKQMFSIRIYADADEVQDITFRLYNRYRGTFEDVTSTMKFTGDIVGTINQPTPLLTTFPATLHFDSDVTYYLYNEEAGAFLTGRDDWYSRAVLGIGSLSASQFRIYDASEYSDNDEYYGAHVLQNYGPSGWYNMYASGTSVMLERSWMDNALWTIESVSDSTYRIAYADPERYSCQYNSFGEDKYIGWDGNNNDPHINITSADKAIAWKLVTEPEYMKFYLTELTPLLQSLQDAINNADPEEVDMDFVAEAQNWLNDVNAAIAESDCTADDIKSWIEDANYFLEEIARITTTLNIDNAGSLQKMLHDNGINANTIVELTLTGEINAADLDVIRHMEKLERIDMSAAHCTDDLPYEWMRYNSVIKEVSLPQGMTRMGDRAFYQCESLESLELPSSMMAMGYYAISYCYNLNTLTVHSFLPPHIYYDYEWNSGVSKDNITLRIPESSVELYQQHSNWTNNVGNIETIADPEVAYIYEETAFVNEALDGKNIRLDFAEYYERGEFEKMNGALTLYSDTAVNLSGFSMNYDYGTEYYEGVRNNHRVSTSFIAAADIKADSVSLCFTVDTESWTFFTLPYDAKVADIKPSHEVTWTIREYDAASRAANGMNEANWKDVSADATLIANKGYIIRAQRQDNSKVAFEIPAAAENKNNIFANADVTVELAQYASSVEDDANWNLIGNPYPAYYEIGCIGTTSPISVYDKQSENYKAYSPVDDEYTLRPGQAFFIQSAGAEELTFAEIGRQNDPINSQNNYRTRQRATGMNERAIINLAISADNEELDGTRIVLNPEASLAYEQSCDAAKFFGQGRAQLFTMASNVKYAINERPLQSGVIRLGAELKESGQYSIVLGDVQNFSQRLFIEDTELGTMTEITADQPYRFAADEGTCVGRFYLHIANDEPTAIAGIGAAESADDIYTLQGVKVRSAAKKGIYVVGNKKVIVK